MRRPGIPPALLGGLASDGPENEVWAGARRHSDKDAWEYGGHQKAISEAAELTTELVGQCITLGTW